MELIKNWILGVTCAAMLVAVAESLMPSGTVKKIGKLTGGVVLLLAVIQPLMGLDFESLSMALTESRESMHVLSEEEASAVSADLMKSIIADKTGAYILDKANSMGISCTVDVECKVGEGNIPYPVSVTVMGRLTDTQRDALTRDIEANLAIPADRQLYESGDVE